MGVETGGCTHTAIRENASMNLAAIVDMNRKFPHAELCFVESGGDNLAATFSPELADLTIYVIDVAEGEKIPRKGGPGITRSDLLVVNQNRFGSSSRCKSGCHGSGYAENARQATPRFYEF